jgi:hypothetical protein
MKTFKKNTEIGTAHSSVEYIITITISLRNDQFKTQPHSWQSLYE